MFRRLLSGFFVAALALAGAAAAPVHAERPAGWGAADQAALVQTARSEQRLTRAGEGRSAPQHPLLALPPALGALARSAPEVLSAPAAVSLRLPTTSRSVHGARAPPA